MAGGEISAASLRVSATADGRPRYDEMRSSAMTVLRPTESGVYMVSGMAAPLPGDRSHLDVHVGAGASLVIRSAGATVARGRDGEGSVSTVTAAVEGGAALFWCPEPAVAAAGCRHRAAATVRMAADATLVWHEAVVLGRTGEPSGQWRSTLSVDVGGTPALRSCLGVGGAGTGWEGPAVTGGARAISSTVLSGPDVEALPGGGVTVETGTGRAAAMSLAAGGLLVSAYAADHRALLTVLVALTRELPAPTAARMACVGGLAG